MPLQLQLKEQVKSLGNCNHNKVCTVIFFFLIIPMKKLFFFFTPYTISRKNSQLGESPAIALMISILPWTQNNSHKCQWTSRNIWAWSILLCVCGKIFDCTNLEFTLRSTSKLLFSSYYYDPWLHTISIIILSKQLQ